MSQPDRPDLGALDLAGVFAGDPELAADSRGVMVPETALTRYVAAVAALLGELAGMTLPERCGQLLAEVTDRTRILHGRTVRLLPAHLYDLARRTPGMAAPYELWAPLVESGLRLQEERDHLTDAVHAVGEERDRARDVAVALEGELARVDELIGRARFEVDPDDPDGHYEAWRELVARIRVGVTP